MKHLETTGGLPHIKKWSRLDRGDAGATDGSGSAHRPAMGAAAGAHAAGHVGCAGAHGRSSACCGASLSAAAHLRCSQACCGEAARGRGASSRRSAGACRTRGAPTTSCAPHPICGSRRLHPPLLHRPPLASLCASLCPSLTRACPPAPAAGCGGLRCGAQPRVASRHPAHLWREGKRRL